MLETRKAYEYALDRIGLDLHAAGLWQEYIKYLQMPRPNTPAYRALWSSTAAPGQEEAQRVMTLRFCLRIPLHDHVGSVGEASGSTACILRISCSCEHQL